MHLNHLRPDNARDQSLSAVPVRSKRLRFKHLGKPQKKRISITFSTSNKMEDLDDGMNKNESAMGPANLDRPEGILRGSTLFYLLMFLMSSWLGEIGGYNIYKQMVSTIPDLVAAIVWLIPLLTALSLSLFFTDKLRALRELKSAFQATLIPTLSVIPPWGLAVISIGAGIGEEALFRGLIQSGVTSLPFLHGGTQATIASVVASAVLFGLVHALSPAYFWYATFAGCIFGLEAVYAGLSTAALTHSLYDAIALLAILYFWKAEKRV